VTEPQDRLSTDPPRPPGTPDVDELVDDPATGDDGPRVEPDDEDVVDDDAPAVEPPD
jgi:hypothetical protein